MSQQLSAFRSRIQELELELQEFKSGRKVVSEDGSVVINDMAYEITMLRTENDKCVCFAAKFRITAYIPDWVVVLSFVHQTLARVLHCYIAVNFAAISIYTLIVLYGLAINVLAEYLFITNIVCGLRLIVLYICFILRLRLRVKAMQQVIESQSNRLANLTAEKEAAKLDRHDESTGQGN